MSTGLQIEIDEIDRLIDRLIDTQINRLLPG